MFFGGLLKHPPVTLINPLELLVDRIGLLELVKDNIRLHNAGELMTVHTAQSRLDAQLQTKQLQDFAAWLDEPEQAREEHITVFLYPDAAKD